MQAVLSIEIPTGEFNELTQLPITKVFFRVWDGPIVPVGTGVCPFPPGPIYFSYTVVEVELSAVNNRVTMFCGSGDVAGYTASNPAPLAEIETTLRNHGWLTLDEFYPEDMSIEDEQRGRMQLTFKTSGMPTDIFDELYDNQNVVPDGVGQYNVGYFVSEYENASEQDRQRSYSPESVAMAQKIDKYFMARGATRGQTVFIEHG